VTLTFATGTSIALPYGLDGKKKKDKKGKKKK
jgi:hypothetical protein